MAARPNDTVPDMLDEPSLSRQWVLRRMQQCLTTELAAHAFAAGLAASAGSPHTSGLRELEACSARRVDLLERSIRGEGGAPYSSVGLARATSRLGGRVMGLLGAWSWRPILDRVLEHAAGELDALAGFAATADGIDPDLADRLRPLAAEVQRNRAAVAPGGVVS